jgi:hypothetical protein
LVRYHVFFVIRLVTREVHIAGIIPEPNGPWMKQMARNLTDGMDGFLNGCRYVIHDPAAGISEGSVPLTIIWRRHALSGVPSRSRFSPRPAPSRARRTPDSRESAIG